MASSKKLSKKELQEDKLVDSYAKVVEFWKKYNKNILTAVGIIAVAIVLLGIYVESVKTANLEASAKFAKVMKVYNAERYGEAIDGKAGEFEGLKSIVEEYGSTESGQVAKIYLANAYFFLSDFNNALEAYKSYSGNNDIFKATAFAGQGYCLMQMEKYENAVSKFYKAADVSESNPHNAEYLLNAGLSLLKANKTEEAKEAFNKVLKKYPVGTNANEAKRMLAKLNN